MLGIGKYCGNKIGQSWNRGNARDGEYRPEGEDLWSLRSFEVSGEHSTTQSMKHAVSQLVACLPVPLIRYKGHRMQQREWHREEERMVDVGRQRLGQHK